MNNQKLQVKVVGVGFLPNSRNGNPKYSLKTEDGKIYKTPADAMWVYGVNWAHVYNHACDGKNIDIEFHETPKGRLILDNVNVQDYDAKKRRFQL